MNLAAIPVSVPSQHPDPIPQKVRAAMEFIHFAEHMRRGSGGNPFGGDTPQDNARPLTKMEAEVYDSALTVLLEYFGTPGFHVPNPAQAQPATVS